MRTLQSHPEGLPPLWVAVAVVLAVGALGAVMIQVSYLRQKRKMDELWAAAHEADRRFYAALYAYLSQPVERETRTAGAESAAEITVELEVIKTDKTGKKEEKGKT